MTEDELQKILETALPAADLHDVFVEECQGQDIRLRFSLKPGERWSTTALLSLVDTSLRATTGLGSSLSHLNVTVLRPAHAADVIAVSRAIRRTGETVPRDRIESPTTCRLSARAALTMRSGVSRMPS